MITPSVRQELRHAFGTGTSQREQILTDQEQAIIIKLVSAIRKRGLKTPAILFLEYAQPLNYLGSQLMVFFRPFLTFFFSPSEYDLLQGILEKREGIKRIIGELERGDP